ncbi:MAG: acyl-CoA dehydrogenase [Alphaproteobacteria bacterium]|nr:acyl-CoA dehydrogenase [Alphaproteobacteria bacterium]
MDFSISPEQASFQILARNFANDQLAPFASTWDREEIFPVPTLRKAAELGFGGIMVRPEFGGCGLGRLDSVLIFEELAKGCPSTVGYLSVHNMVSYLLDRYGSFNQHQKWLPKLTTMQWLSSYCLTEPEFGSDAASLATKAIREGDFYKITGTKAFISGGGVSDLYLCMARTGEPGAKGITAFLIEKDTPGLSFGKCEDKMGWRCQPTTMVVLDGVRVPVANRLGEEGDGFKIAMNGLDGGRLNIAACSLGGAQACLELALKYANERKQFGNKLNEFQATQFRLADMATELAAAQLMVHKAACMLDKGNTDATLFCAMAKRLATDTGFKVANDALQLHGGYGYIKDFQVERYLRDLRVHQILEGTNEIMRVIIARKLIETFKE